MVDLFIALIVFVIIISVMLFLRTKIGEKFEIKNSDILIALVPIAFWLILTGKIQKLEFGEFKIEAAFVEAAGAAITPQISELELPVEPLEMSPKSGVNMIPQLIRNKTQALTFQLGYGYYYGPAIKEYLHELTQVPSFKYIVIGNSDASFAGMFDARQLNAALALESRGYAHFADWLNDGDEASIAKLPGYINQDQAIYKKVDKQSALEKMDAMDIEMLPVINTENRFMGIVERSRLVSSMILEVTQKLQ